MIDAKVDWKALNELGKNDWMAVILGEEVRPKFKWQHVRRPQQKLPCMKTIIFYFFGTAAELRNAFHKLPVKCNCHG